jgi:hypothetical protein
MRFRRARPFAHALFAVCVLSTPARPAAAQTHDDHAMPTMGSRHKLTPQQNALVKAVRDATKPFAGVTTIAGPGGGYELAFGCVSGGDFGAMGLHYVNMSLLGDGEVQAGQPEIILYEPTPSGGIRITGADYLVYADQWDADEKHKGSPPSLMGQLFHRFDSPNRFRLPAFYTLHVWAWKDNPNGTFTNWNPDVSCDGFNAPTPSED